MRCDVGGNFDRPVWDSLHRDRPFGSLGRLQRFEIPLGSSYHVRIGVERDATALQQEPVL